MMGVTFDKKSLKSVERLFPNTELLIESLHSLLNFSFFSFVGKCNCQKWCVSSNLKLYNPLLLGHALKIFSKKLDCNFSFVVFAKL